MIRVLILFCLGLSLSACVSVDVNGYIVPGETLEYDRQYYIVFSRNDEHALHDILERGMTVKGISVSTGFPDRMPLNTGYIVEYGGQWQWDVTWYLLNFNVRVYDPETKLLIASASSLRTSLGRKSPEEIVSETLSQIFVDKS